MADKTIGQLVAAPSNLAEYTGQELFVLEQNNTAKKLTMQILENWLVSFADGHGGIQTINKTATSGLVDTYTITFADQSTATFTVTNGNGITGVTQYWAVSASNTTVPSSWSTTRQTMTPTNKYLWSYMTFARDSGSFSTTKSVVGVYGDTGQAWYVWIKYAGVQPTSDADMGDTPDNWMGLYSGTQATAPTSYTAYQWFEIKGETGNTGATGASIASVTRTGGTGEPGSTDTYTITLDTGAIAGTFTVYNGLNGSGAVATVNNVQPDGNGNVQINASNISTSGGQDVQAVLSSYWTSIQAAQSTASEAQTAAGTAQQTANTAQTTADGKAPTNHASTATTYGVGDASNYGHVKLSDTPDASQDAGDGVAATPAAVQTAYNAAIAFEDITDQITWDSTVNQKQALRNGNLLILRFKAERSASTARWNYATIPASVGTVDGRWTGIGIMNQNTYGIRTHANQVICTESFSSNQAWIQGQIVIVLNMPSVEI